MVAIGSTTMKACAGRNPDVQRLHEESAPNLTQSELRCHHVRRCCRALSSALITSRDARSLRQAGDALTPHEAPVRDEQDRERSARPEPGSVASLLLRAAERRPPPDT